MVRVIAAAAWIAVIIAVITGAAAAPTAPPRVHAQDSTLTCAQIYQQALADMMAHCYNLAPGTVCGATGDVTITTVSGQTATGAGASARLNGVATLELGDTGDTWPLASFALPDPFDARKTTTVIVLGPARVQFDDAAALPPGTAFALETASAPLCSDLPYPGVLVQSAESSLTNLRINDTEVMVNGMALISTRTGGTLQVNALTKETVLGQSGTVVFAGYGVSVTGEFAGEVAPYDAARVANLPVQILPRMQRVALPGNATVTKSMNLYFEPGPEYYGSTIIAEGLPVNVFGRDDSGQWLYIRSYEGYEGWLPAYVLAVDVSGDLPVLAETPPALSRPFGSVQTYIKTSYENNNLREGPGEQFAIVKSVPLWTDLALYGRSPDGDWLLVETLDDELRGWLNVALVSNATPYTLSELPLPPDMVE